MKVNDKFKVVKPLTCWAAVTTPNDTDKFPIGTVITIKALDDAGFYFEAQGYINHGTYSSLFYDNFEVVKEHLKSLEEFRTSEAQRIATYFKNEKLSGFATQLMRTFQMADSRNQEKLGTAFPEYLEAYKIWMKG